jgi:hypothetical protein
MKNRLKIYGERNTNTNYLSKLIGLNLEVQEIAGVVPNWVSKIQGVIPGREWVKDLYFKNSHSENLGWKHTKVCPFDSYSNAFSEIANVGFITITKNPYSWLLSLYKKPYHQYYKKKPDFEEFLTSPWKSLGRDNVDKNWVTPIELWNIKNRSYLDMGDVNYINTTTEDIFLSPEQLISKVCEKFSIGRKSEEFLNYERSTKNSGKDSNWYRNYYLNEEWAEEISASAIDIINERVDSDLMGIYNYNIR